MTVTSRAFAFNGRTSASAHSDDDNARTEEQGRDWTRETKTETPLLFQFQELHHHLQCRLCILLQKLKLHWKSTFMRWKSYHCEDAESASQTQMHFSCIHRWWERQISKGCTNFCQKGARATWIPTKSTIFPTELCINFIQSISYVPILWRSEPKIEECNKKTHACTIIVHCTCTGTYRWKQTQMIIGDDGKWQKG